MGLPMLEALLRSGLDARGFDLREIGGPVTTDEREFSEGLRTLITVVRDQAETEEVLFGAQGFATRVPTLSRIVISSTLSPRYTRALRDRVPAGIALVDAPMSGAEIAAREAALSFMLGGADADLDALQPALAAMGAHFHRMGGFGTGMQAKVLNNLLAAANTAMTRLVLDWGDAAGLDTAALLALIHTSSGQNWFASGFDRIEFARDGNAPENTIGIIVKDVEAALDDAPAGADTALPRAVRDAVAALERMKRG